MLYMKCVLESKWKVPKTLYSKCFVERNFMRYKACASTDKYLKKWEIVQIRKQVKV